MTSPLVRGSANKLLPRQDDSESISTMSMPPRERETQRRTKACTRCRQQKLRCDAYWDYSQPCSRCRRMSLQCIISDAFKRTTRLTKVEMQREIERLQDMLQSPPPTQNEGALSNRRFWDPADMMTPSTSHSQEATVQPVPIQSLLAPGEGPMSEDIATDRPASVARSLCGIELPPENIDDLFALFFNNYAPFLPIVDIKTPVECYEQSPFLFWVMVYVGSRRYTDPTLMERLATPIIDLAFSSLASRSQPIQIVQGLLFLCSWPVPVDTKGKDISHVLAGAAMQLAMQNGLHTFGNGQEFSRTMLRPGKNGKANDAALRARLWAYCVIICQSVSLSDGLPPFLVLDSFNFDTSQTNMWAVLPPDLRLRLKFHVAQIDAVAAFMRNRLAVDSSVDGSSMLNSLIEVYDQRIQDLATEPLHGFDKLFFDCARLNIRVFHFFGKLDHIHWAGFHNLYNVACAVIDDLVQLDGYHNFCLYAPHCAAWIIMLAACTILRLCRSQLGQQLDTRRGEQAYFAAIHLHRKKSVQNDDLPARGGVIMTQLWLSETIFRRRDGGSDSLRLRTHNRLSLSVVFDCFWWWRAEFGGQLNPYSSELSESAEHGDALQGQVTPQVPTAESHETPVGPEALDGTLLDDPGMDHDLEIVPDWDWAACLQFPLQNYT